jgi:hypothetical protein
MQSRLGQRVKSGHGDCPTWRTSVIGPPGGRAGSAASPKSRGGGGGVVHDGGEKIGAASVGSV